MVEVIRTHMHPWVERVWRAALALTPLQRALFVIGALFYFALSVAILMAGEQIFHTVARTSTWFARSPVGIPVLYAIMCILGFPPMAGFGTSITLCGMAFGSARNTEDFAWHAQLRRVLWAYVLATGGYVLSATVAFLVLRYFISLLEDRWAVVRTAKEDPRFRAVQGAVDESRLWVSILLRFCPVPFCYANFLFALLDAVPLRTFAAAAVITSPRLLIHVFVGAKMYELMDRDVRNLMDPTARTLSTISVIVGIAAGAGVGWYIWREASRILRLDGVPFMPLANQEPETHELEPA